MKTRTIVVALVLFFVGSVFCLAEDGNVGSWKLNEAKSKFSAGAPKTTTSVYETSGDNTKVTLDGIGFDGNPTHNEWIGKYDGKDYPVTGDSNQTSRAYKMVNPHKMKFVVKHDDKVILSGTINVSPDGKTRTVKANGMSTTGKKVNYTAIYDKQ